jgi:hypothetical protein
MPKMWLYAGLSDLSRTLREEANLQMVKEKE